MKFTVLFIRVMLLKGMELHRHINRHGHKGQTTDPQRETNELIEIDKAVDTQQPVDVTVVQKDVRSNPGNTDENAVNADGTKCAKTLENNYEDVRYLIMADTQASKAVKEWCAWAIPYIEY